jgi:hypothetical protein
MSKKYFLNYTLFSFVLFIISIFIDIFLPQIKISEVWYWLLLFLYILNLMLLNLLLKENNKKSIRFINTFMLTGFGKMFLYVVIMFVYAYLNPNDAVSFIITFLFYFVAYLAYEVNILLKLNKKSINK